MYLFSSLVKWFGNSCSEFENGGIALYTAESLREDLDKEIFADIHLTKYPVREFNSILNDLTNVVGTYEKLNHRNHKKDDNHLNKHAMHLIRLYLMCLDILEKGDIITYRGSDLPLLMSIRKGDYQLEDNASSVHSVLFCHIFLLRLFSIPAYMANAPHPT